MLAFIVVCEVSWEGDVVWNVLDKQLAEVVADSGGSIRLLACHSYVNL